jgi:ATP-dependent RNA helicase DHX37/DHR1
MMKAMSIDSVLNFPFPSPPKGSNLRKAHEVLRHLGALDEDRKITELGNSLNLFPLNPRFSKMLVIGKQHGCLPYVIAMVAVLSVGNPFLSEEALFGPQSNHGQGEEDLEGVKQSEQQRAMKKQFFKSAEVGSRETLVEQRIH